MKLKSNQNLKSHGWWERKLETDTVAFNIVYIVYIALNSDMADDENIIDSSLSVTVRIWNTMQDWNGDGDGDGPQFSMLYLLDPMSLQVKNCRHLEKYWGQSLAQTNH